MRGDEGGEEGLGEGGRDWEGTSPCIIHTPAQPENSQSNQVAIESVDAHFICFVEVEGCLYELDGKTNPLCQPHPSLPPPPKPPNPRAAAPNKKCYSINLRATPDSLANKTGRKKTPINHGPCESQELLSKACTVIRDFMARDPEELRFAITALAAASAE